MDLPTRLAERLDGQSPSVASRRRLSPELSFGRQSGPPPATARRAAVMMLLYPHDDRWHLPLTVRPEGLSDHAGQVSFPGGLTEPGESSCEAALRELEEELGVSGGIDVLGQLADFYVFVSYFWDTPWVGVIDRRPAWVPNPAEVSELLEVPIRDLLDGNSVQKCLITRGELSFSAPYFAWRNHKIWGATGMMLSELVSLVEEIDV